MIILTINNTVKNLLTVTNKNIFKEITNGFNLNLLDPVEAAILKYKSHPSLNAIRGKISELVNPNFCFEYTSIDQTLTSQVNDIPVKVIKENKDIIASFVYHNFNNSLSGSNFPTALKYTDVKPVLKKDDKTDKENYRPISILPTLIKVYERLADKHSSYFE